MTEFKILNHFILTRNLRGIIYKPMYCHPLARGRIGGGNKPTTVTFLCTYPSKICRSPDAYHSLCYEKLLVLHFSGYTLDTAYSKGIHNQNTGLEECLHRVYLTPLHTVFCRPFCFEPDIDELHGDWSERWKWSRYQTTVLGGLLRSRSFL